MKSMFILAISLLIACATADWTTPIALFGKKVIIRDYDTAVDEEGNTYIAYCTETVDNKGNVSNGLIYTRMSPDDKLDNPINFKLVTGCRDVKIQLGPEDKTIMVAYEGKRSQGMSLCTKDNPHGCYDIYIMISTNLGIDWTKPSPIKRELLNDITDRLNPHFVVDKVTKQSFLFYTRKPTSLDKATLAYTTRGENKEFEREWIIHDATVDGKLISALTSREKYTTVSHVFYESEGRVEHLVNKNVNSWEIDDFFNAAEHYTQFVVGVGNETSMLVGIHTDGEKTYFKYSPDHGRTWSESKVIDYKYHKSAVATLIAKTDKEYELMLLTSSFMSKNQAFLSTTIPNISVKVHPAPFTNIKNFGVFMTQLNCYAESKKRTHKAFGYIWVSGTEPEVHVTSFSNND